MSPAASGGRRRKRSPPARIRTAIRYYAEYRDDVDRFIELNEEEADRLERTLEHERRILG